jgi:hypothetical protein
MNTEQTKTLGQLAYENDSTSSDAKNTYQWGDEHPLCHARYERMAQAVATEVLNRLPGEWVLLHEEEIIEIGDEKYSVGMWAPVSVNVLGKMVGGRIVRRRLSPVPSQQPQLGSPKEPESCPACNSLVGWLFAQNPDKTLNKARSECHSCGYTMDHVTPPPAPRAEWKPKFKVGDRVRVEGFQTTFTVEYLPHDSKDAYRMVGGYNAKEGELTAAPWKLPEPPEGRQWHRLDWTQEMLPEGWRPLLLGEYGVINIDEFASYPNGVWLSVQATGPSVPGQLHTRTTRPLHAPSIPQPEEIPYEETDLFHARKALLDEGMRANTLKQERDAALARVKAAEDGQETWRKSSNTFQDRAIAAEARASEAEKRADERIAGYRDTAIEALEKARSHELELTTLRASVPVWVPCNRVMPTEKDATQTPAGECVIWGNQRGEWLDHWNALFSAAQYPPTHWRKLYLPPLPVETEEGEDRLGFEAVAVQRGNSVERDSADGTRYAIARTQQDWKLWQAALRSKKPS